MPFASAQRYRPVPERLTEQKRQKQLLHRRTSSISLKKLRGPKHEALHGAMARWLGLKFLAAARAIRAGV
jgi:hypothetical protein